MIMMLPCLDSDERAIACREDLDVSRGVAAGLGRSAVTAAERGYYFYGDDRRIDQASGAGVRFPSEFLRGVGMGTP